MLIHYSVNQDQGPFFFLADNYTYRSILFLDCMHKSISTNSNNSSGGGCDNLIGYLFLAFFNSLYSVVTFFDRLYFQK